MKWDIFHRTRYLYASPVRESFNEVRLSPISNREQTVESFLLKVLPAARLRHYLDFYSNVIHHFEIPEPHSELLIESRAVVTVHRPPPLDPQLTPAPLAELSRAVAGERCFDYLQPSRYVDLDPETWRHAVDATQDQTDAWQATLAIMRHVHGALKYEPNSTLVHTHARQALQQRAGVCQDFAHVMIGMCRSVGLPALYVSGYLATETASATHAWVEVFVPGHGWVALDPTHNRQADDTYVKIAVGRDYADVPPVTGHYRGTLARSLKVEVQVTRLGWE
jgi:transglutaminase-like putative cysteine protease